MKPVVYRLLFVFGVMLACGIWMGNTPVSPIHEKGVSPLFASDDILKLTLAVNMNELLSDRGTDASYHKASLSVFEESSTWDVPVKVKARGNFRRAENHCVFPPLRLKFGKQNPPISVFENQKKLKLVTHCSEDEYLLKEFLVYRLYNLLSDRSFRVRLANITYVDMQGLTEPYTRLAFFIEDEDHMAERNDSRIVKDRRVSSKEIEPNHLLSLYTFQYMIGNRDWDIFLQKNIKVVMNDNDSIPYAVPYDFDWTGTVQAPYTKMEEYVRAGFSLRKFRSLCRTPEEFEACFQVFREKKDEIYQLFQTFPYLKPKQASKSLKYFDDFYEIIENPKKVKKEFLDTCKQ